MKKEAEKPGDEMAVDRSAVKHPPTTTKPPKTPESLDTELDESGNEQECIEPKKAPKSQAPAAWQNLVSHFLTF